jgi:hypothetical protein
LNPGLDRRICPDERRALCPGPSFIRGEQVLNPTSAVSAYSTRHCPPVVVVGVDGSDSVPNFTRTDSRPSSRFSVYVNHVLDLVAGEPRLSLSFYLDDRAPQLVCPSPRVNPSSVETAIGSGRKAGRMPDIGFSAT